jgi:hypothetical protein
MSWHEIVPRKDEGMKIEDGYVKIHAKELLANNTIVRELAKCATFNRTIAEGIVELMLTDDVDWPDDADEPWYSIVGFGGNWFEQARAKVIEHADEAARTQVAAMQKERDHANELYKKYQTEANNDHTRGAGLCQENTVVVDKKYLRRVIDLAKFAVVKIQAADGYDGTLSPTELSEAVESVELCLALDEK